ncbi:MAG: GDP-mannose 4,6-dehydratase, partial [Thermoplasmata archaeon]|nr:GDP-mannose 4,6-dehydratase [Thermoplasmata archaeon]
MQRVLVTGGTGFLGRHMTRSLAASGLEVVATHFHEPARQQEPRPANVSYRHLDLRSPETVKPLIDSVQPDCVFHFAGQAYVVPSWEDPPETFAVNFGGTLALLEALRTTAPQCRFVFAGSGTEYGEPEQVPTPEEAPLLPTSPYATSKAAADLLCYQYFRSYAMPTYRLRIFGTTGVGKLGDVCNDFASQVARIEADPHHPKVRVGDLDKK